MLSATLLQIRYIQLRREIRTLPWLHRLLFLLLLCGIVAICHSVFHKSLQGWLVPGALLLSALAMQLYRPDKDFIFLHFNSPRQAIFSEYAVFSFPFILPALFSPNWYCFPVYFLGLGAITFIRSRFRLQTRYTFLGWLLLDTAFEWISGLRRAFPVFALIYLLALTFCWVKALPLFLLWVLNLLFISFYQEGEPLHLLRIYAESPVDLLRKKLFSHGLLLFCLNFPVLLLQAFIHPVIGLIGIIFLLLQFIAMAFALFLKYATYRPGEVTTSNTLLVTLAQMGILLPFLLPLPLIMCFRYYGRAVQNLKLYLPA